MDANKKRLREYKDRKRAANDRDGAPVVIVRILWFLVKLAAGAAATVLLVALIAGILFSVDMATYLKDDVLVSSDMSLDDYTLSQTSFIYAMNKQTGEYEELQQIYATEIQPVHPKGDQSWVFIGGTDAEAGTPILWPPHAKN